MIGGDKKSSPMLKIFLRRAPIGSPVLFGSCFHSRRFPVPEFR
jgi:hypothetical protein